MIVALGVLIFGLGMVFIIINLEELKRSEAETQKGILKLDERLTEIHKECRYILEKVREVPRGAKI